MARLIDAEQMLIDESEAYMRAQMKTDGLTHLVNEAVHKKIQMLLADTPTAYDLDKVLQQLEAELAKAEKDLNATNHPFYVARYGARVGAFRQAIDIMKGGGKNDGNGSTNRRA